MVIDEFNNDHQVSVDKPIAKVTIDSGTNVNAESKSAIRRTSC